MSHSNTARSFLISALSNNCIASWYFDSKTPTRLLSTFASTSAIGFFYGGFTTSRFGLLNCYYECLCLLMGGRFSFYYWDGSTPWVLRASSDTGCLVWWIQSPTPFWFEESCYRSPDGILPLFCYCWNPLEFIGAYPPSFGVLSPLVVRGYLGGFELLADLTLSEGGLDDSYCYECCMIISCF